MARNQKDEGVALNSKLVRTKMEDMEMSVLDLAKAMDVPNSTVYRILANPNQYIRIDFINRLAKALSVPPKDLLI